MMTHPDLEHLRRTYLDLSQRIGLRESRRESVAAFGGEDLRPRELFGRTAEYAPSLEEILDTYLRNYTGRNIPKSRRVQALNLEVVLSEEELREGAHLPLRVPIFEACPRCEGTGHAGFFTCDRCGGEGIMTGIHRIDVLIPAGTREGTVIPLSLRQLGVGNLWINLHVRVSG